MSGNKYYRISLWLEWIQRVLYSWRQHITRFVTTNNNVFLAWGFVPIELNCKLYIYCSFNTSGKIYYRIRLWLEWIHRVLYSMPQPITRFDMVNNNVFFRLEIRSYWTELWSLYIYIYIYIYSSFNTSGNRYYQIRLWLEWLHRVLYSWPQRITRFDIANNNVLFRLGIRSYWY
jgi:hypothetical protein